MGKRLFIFDALRCLAAFWIISIWHFANYFTSDIFISGITNNIVCLNVTYVMLSLFMFLSGLFTKGKFGNIDNIKEYYFKKIKRFYPLYALAAFTLFLSVPPHNMTFYNSISQLFLSLLGLASLTKCAPSTLWFMDMLLLFILITPLLKWGSNKQSLLMMFIILILLYVFSKKLSFIDNRFVRYAPFYFMGLLMSPNGFIEVCNKYGFKCLVIAPLLFFTRNNFLFIDIIMYALMIIGMGYLMLIVCRRLENQIIVTKLIGIISYSSMCAYFFHRQLYALGILFQIPIWLLPFIVFIIAFYIQKFYDYIIQTIHE